MGGEGPAHAGEELAHGGEELAHGAAAPTARGQAAARRERETRLALVAALGIVALLVAFVSGMPGSGAFIVAAWLVGLWAALLGTGTTGFLLLAMILGVPPAVASLADGSLGMPVLLGLPLVALAGNGMLVGAVIRRIRALGLRAVLDPGVIAGLAVAVVLAVALGVVATMLAIGSP